MCRSFFKRSVLFVTLTSTLCTSLLTGCASGGFKLTREYSGWVNRQHIVVRIILYILTLPVYLVTILIDAVIFNTMDFWDGRVSQGDYKFQHNDETYFVQHRLDSKTGLRSSRIEILATNKKRQIIELKETHTHQVELFVDNQLRARSSTLGAQALLKVYNANGKIIETHKIQNETLYSAK